MSVRGGSSSAASSPALADEVAPAAVSARTIGGPLGPGDSVVAATASLLAVRQPPQDHRAELERARIERPREEDREGLSAQPDALSLLAHDHVVLAVAGPVRDLEHVGRLLARIAVEEQAPRPHDHGPPPLDDHQRSRWSGASFDAHDRDRSAADRLHGRRGPLPGEARLRRVSTEAHLDRVSP